MKLYWIGVGPKSNDWCPYKKAIRRYRNTEKECHVDMTTDIRVIQSISQGTPRIVSSYQKIGEEQRTDSPLEFPEGTNSAL